MKQIEKMLEFTAEGTPWALARFNDGEMGAITGTMNTVARGHQPVTPGLTRALHKALATRVDRYFVGTPCPNRYPELAAAADKIVGDYAWRTLAVVTANRNWQRWIDGFSAAAQGRRIRWIGGAAHRVLGNTELGFSIYEHIRLPMRDAWGARTRIDGLWRNFTAGDITLLSCGPLSRVIACRWFQHRPDCTFIDIGSTYDPWTTGKTHRYQRGKAPPCSICN